MSRQKNLLCFGDNLVLLKDQNLFPDESVDLIYLDPPFNSQRNYKVLFREQDGTPSESQIKAFDDTWQWDSNAAERLDELYAAASESVVEVIRALELMLRHSPMFAYLVQMTARLTMLHRVLKKTGSLYLHCDPTASHYLKIVLDAIFGPKHFQNEIIWKRTSAHSSAKRFGPIHDVILFFSKSSNYVWNPQYSEYSKDYLDQFYRFEDEHGKRYRLSDLTGAGTRNGKTGENWRDINVTTRGGHWMVPPNELEELDKKGRIYWPPKGVMPAYKRFLDEMPGVPLQDIFDNVQPIGAHALERLGYPTQKPVELLKRIILASSNPGDVILDPFCGCGTTIDAVETINRETPELASRKWIGIDITYLAVALIKSRLARFENPKAQFDIHGEPEDLESARWLAQKEQDRYQFQYWALGLVGARPAGQDKKKGKDQGIDGVRYFTDEPGAPIKKALIQVKSGHVKSGDIRDLRGTVERENAALGIFLTLEPSTKDMRTEANSAGFYTSPADQQKYHRIQILTIEEILTCGDQPPNPRCLKFPHNLSTDHTFKKAKKHIGETLVQGARAKQDLLELE